MNPIPQIKLKPKKDRPLQLRHPWVFSGALTANPSILPGSLVDFVNDKGNFLARGYYNPNPSLAGRVLSWQKEEIDRPFLKQRIIKAQELRKFLGLTSGDSFRLISSEADGLPGLIVEKFASCLVVQVLSAGMNQLLPAIAEILMELYPDSLIIERSEDAMRKKEGLTQSVSRVISGELISFPIEIVENGLKFLTDPMDGQKTGFYLDQRVNRQIIRQYAKGKRVLDCFSYTGGFSVNAAVAGAQSITAVDQSEWALNRLEEHCNLNGIKNTDSLIDGICGDAFQILRDMQTSNEKFDLIIMDPPKFIKNRSQVDRGSRGYKDVNRLALQMLNPGGILATFSCSAHMTADLFQKVIFGAATDALADAHILQYLNQAPDHPILMTVPESYYLNGLLLRKT